MIVIVFWSFMSSLTGNFSASVPGIIKTMHTGFSAYTYCIMPTRPSTDTEETGRYDLAWKDCVIVLNTSQ